MWYKITINTVSIAEKDPDIPFFQSLVHFSKRFSISCAALPIDELFCGFAIGPPDPISSFWERKNATFHQVQSLRYRQLAPVWDSYFCERFQPNERRVNIDFKKLGDGF